MCAILSNIERRLQMNTYSVKEISGMLGTSQETVRRWIRSGKLNASQDSRKGGNSVTEADLQKFLKKSPKYSTIAAGSIAASTALIGAAPVIGLPFAIGALLGGIVGAAGEKSREKKGVNPEDVLKMLSESIRQSENNIEKKQEAITQLEAEIAQEKKQVVALQDTAERIKKRVREEHESEG